MFFSADFFLFYIFFFRVSITTINAELKFIVQPENDRQNEVLPLFFDSFLYYFWMWRIYILLQSCIGLRLWKFKKKYDKYIYAFLVIIVAWLHLCARLHTHVDWQYHCPWRCGTQTPLSPAVTRNFKAIQSIFIGTLTVYWFHAIDFLCILFFLRCEFGQIDNRWISDSKDQFQGRCFP